MHFRININEFKDKEYYINTEILKDKNINLIFNTDYKKNKFYIFNQIYRADDEEEYIIELLQIIDIDIQKTGYGYKHFLICPKCGYRRQFLYLNDSLYFECRKCTDENVYKARTSLFDEDIENVIKYKIVQQLQKLSDPIAKVCMIELPSGIPERPQYMREDKYSLICMRIHFLTWMYWQHVSGKQYFTAREINEMLEENNTRFVYENILFSQFYPLADGLLKQYETSII